MTAKSRSRVVASSSPVHRFLNRETILATLLLIAATTAVPAPTAATDDLTQPIRVSTDGHFLVKPSGEPFFWLGDTAWELFHRLTREETNYYLQDRARKGFNVIQAVVTGELDYPGLRNPNRYGDVPFIDVDAMRPNPRYFDHIDWVIERAAHYHIRMAILPVWGATLVSAGQPPVFDVGNAEVYGRWLGERYRGKGVIWVLGGDTNPIVSTTWGKFFEESLNGGRSDDQSTYPHVVDYRPVYDAMAKGIVSAQGRDAFITYHPTTGSPVGTAVPQMSLYFADRNWLDMSMLQSGAGNPTAATHNGGSYKDGHFSWSRGFDYLPIRGEYDASPARPVINGEPGYENDRALTNQKQEKDSSWPAHRIRQQLYQALFAGAAGHTYGNVSLWDLYDPQRVGQTADGYVEKLLQHLERKPWQQTLSAPAASQMQHAKALMLSRPYFTRIPDQNVIVGDVGEGEAHIGATRDRNGSYIMVYLPQGQPVTVNLNKISGTSAIGWWFDPRTGKSTRIERTVPTNRTQRFTPPTSGPDQDWVFVIDDASKGFEPPASAAHDEVISSDPSSSQQL